MCINVNKLILGHIFCFRINDDVIEDYNVAENCTDNANNGNVHFIFYYFHWNKCLVK